MIKSAAVFALLIALTATVAAVLVRAAPFAATAWRAAYGHDIIDGQSSHKLQPLPLPISGRTASSSVVINGALILLGGCNTNLSSSAIPGNELPVPAAEYRECTNGDPRLTPDIAAFNVNTGLPVDVVGDLGFATSRLKAPFAGNQAAVHVGNYVHLVHACTVLSGSVDISKMTAAEKAWYTETETITLTPPLPPTTAAPTDAPTPAPSDTTPSPTDTPAPPKMMALRPRRGAKALAGDDTTTTTASPPTTSTATAAAATTTDAPQGPTTTPAPTAGPVIARFPRPLANASCARNLEAPVIIGGVFLDTGELSNQIWVYDQEMGGWLQPPHMALLATPVMHAALAATADSIFIVSGIDDKKQVSERVYRMVLLQIRPSAMCLVEIAMLNSGQLPKRYSLFGREEGEDEQRSNGGNLLAPVMFEGILHHRAVTFGGGNLIYFFDGAARAAYLPLDSQPDSRWSSAVHSLPLSPPIAFGVPSHEKNCTAYDLGLGGTVLGAAVMTSNTSGAVLRLFRAGGIFNVSCQIYYTTTSTTTSSTTSSTTSTTSTTTETSTTTTATSTTTTSTETSTTTTHPPTTTTETETSSTTTTEEKPSTTSTTKEEPTTTSTLAPTPPPPLFSANKRHAAAAGVSTLDDSDDVAPLQAANGNNNLHSQPNLQFIRSLWGIALSPLLFTSNTTLRRPSVSLPGDRHIPGSVFNMSVDIDSDTDVVPVCTGLGTPCTWHLSTMQSCDAKHSPGAEPWSTTDVEGDDLATSIFFEGPIPPNLDPLFVCFAADSASLFGACQNVKNVRPAFDILNLFSPLNTNGDQQLTTSPAPAPTTSGSGKTSSTAAPAAVSTKSPSSNNNNNGSGNGNGTNNNGGDNNAPILSEGAIIGIVIAAVMFLLVVFVSYAKKLKTGNKDDPSNIIRDTRYEFLETIGEGQFGKVVRVRRRADDSIFALKYIEIPSVQQLHDALHEFEITRQLQNFPNIITIHDMFLNFEMDGGGSGYGGGGARDKRMSQLRRSSTRGSGLEDQPLLNAAGGGRRPNSASHLTDGGGGGANSSLSPSAYGSGLGRESDVSGGGGASPAHDGRPKRVLCFVMDYHPAGDLQSWVLTRYGVPSASDGSEPNVPEPLLSHIALQLLRTLDFIHAKGIVHRDLKASNILIGSPQDFLTEEQCRQPDQFQRIIVSDFGLAKIMEIHSDGILFGGTAAYAAPEQLKYLEQFFVVHHPPQQSGGGSAVSQPLLVEINASTTTSTVNGAAASTPPAMMTKMSPREGSGSVTPPLSAAQRPVSPPLGAAAADGGSALPSRLQGVTTPPRVEPPGPAADVWSVGCLLYAVCTKRLTPNRGIRELARDMTRAQSEAVFHDQIVSELCGRLKYSAAFVSLITAMLRTDPAQRITATAALTFFRKSSKDSTYYVSGKTHGGKP